MHGILIHFEGNVHYVVLKSVISEPPWRTFCNFATKFSCQPDLCSHSQAQV